MLPGSVGRLVPLIGRRREFGVQGGMKVYRGSAAAARNWLDEQTTGIVTGQWGRSPCWQADLEGVRREVAATAGPPRQEPAPRRGPPAQPSLPPNRGGAGPDLISPPPVETG